MARQAPSNLIGSGLVPSLYQDQMNQAELEYQQQLAALQGDERNLFRDMGFQGGIGEGGAVNFDIDPTAQHGQYQQLLRQIASQIGGARSEVRGRGLGRAGLAKAREQLIRYMMSGEKGNLLAGFNKQAADIFGRRSGALTNRNRQFSQLEGEALNWWDMNNPPDLDPVGYDPVSTGSELASAGQLGGLGDYQPVQADYQPIVPEQDFTATQPYDPMRPQSVRRSQSYGGY